MFQQLPHERELSLRQIFRNLLERQIQRIPVVEDAIQRQRREEIHDFIPWIIIIGIGVYIFTKRGLR